jgi:hypothetical protein
MPKGVLTICRRKLLRVVDSLRILCVRIFGPGLDYHVRVQGFDDVPGSTPVILGSESANMVFVTMCGDNHVELSVTALFNVFGHTHHLIGRIDTNRHTRATKIDQDMAFLIFLLLCRRILESEQKAISKSDLISADHQFCWLRFCTSQHLLKYLRRSRP